MLSTVMLNSSSQMGSQFSLTTVDLAASVVDLPQTNLTYGSLVPVYVITNGLF